MRRACDRIGLPIERLAEVTPLQAMQVCLSLSLEAGDRQGVLQAAQAMAPYVHARLSHSEVHMKHELAGKSDAELLLEAAELERKLIEHQPPEPVHASSDAR